MQVTLILLPMLASAAGCGGGSIPVAPTGPSALPSEPTATGACAVRLQFVLDALGSTSTHSEPVRCQNPSAVARGAVAPASPEVGSTMTVRAWKLVPGRYQVTGRLRSGSSALGVAVLGVLLNGPRTASRYVSR